jgi:salicylate 5-hydroxylase small subunit
MGAPEALSIGSAPTDLTTLLLRARVEALYADYTEALNEDRFEDWPNLFTEACFYLITSRENHERKLPLGLMRAQSRGMLQDRVTAIRKTAMYGPRSIRRVYSGVRIVKQEGARIHSSSSYIAVETLPDELSRVFNAGRSEDVIEFDGERMLFASRIVIYDTLLIPNTLVYPL